MILYNYFALKMLGGFWNLIFEMIRLLVILIS